MFPGVPEESLETAKEKAQKAKEVMQDPERAKEAAQEAARKASQKTMEAKEKVKAEAEETAPGHQHPLCSLSLKVLKKKRQAMHYSRLALFRPGRLPNSNLHPLQTVGMPKPASCRAAGDYLMLRAAEVLMESVQG